MGRSDKPTSKACEVKTMSTDQGSDDQAVLSKAMVEMIEVMTARWTEKMAAAIEDLKTSLCDKGRTLEPSLQSNQEGFVRPEKTNRGLTTGFSERPSFGLGPGPGLSQMKIQLERYSGTGTRTLPANWMRSYEAMASLQNWSDQYKITMLRFYLADEAVTWFDNQTSQGFETMSWYEIKQRFEKYFNQEQVVTPKEVLSKEWDPKTSSFYDHYKEMLRLFEISKLQDSWRVKVLKTSLPSFYARMCSGVETNDSDEWYQRAASIISSLPKFETNPVARTQVRALAAIQDIKALARNAPSDRHDSTEDPSKCLFCCQINPNHKLEDCFCHPRKLRDIIRKPDINMLKEMTKEKDFDVLSEADLEDNDEVM